MNASVSPLHDSGKDQDETRSTVWNDETLDELAAYADTVADVKKKRKALNDTVAAGQSKLVALGFNAGALKAAISYANTAEEDRRNWDESYIFMRRALDCPIQEDLFVAAMQEEVTVTAPPDDDE